MLYTEFNQASDTYTSQRMRVYQVVDDFGDLLGLCGCRQYPEGAYGLSWAYFANGDGRYPRSWTVSETVPWC